ncbi:hypothetical protein ACWGBX_04500 [Streptomyces sp. NPDC055037]
MLLAKASLVNMLLDLGKENTAVLLARSDLPEEIDPQADSGALNRLGLTEEGLASLLPAVRGSAGPVSPETRAAMHAADETISARWASLVSHWTERA